MNGATIGKRSASCARCVVISGPDPQLDCVSLRPGQCPLRGPGRVYQGWIPVPEWGYPRKKDECCFMM